MTPEIELQGMTVGAALARRAAASPDAPYLWTATDELSAGELRRRSGRLATALARRGLRRGDRVTTWLPNRTEWVVAAFALARLGAVNVLANPRYRTGELAYLVAHSRSRCVISGAALGADFDAALAEQQAELGGDPDRLEQRIVVDGPAPVGTLAWDRLAAEPVDEALIAEAADGVGPDDVLYVIYTSGTTGRPKGSMTRHGAALRNARNSGVRMGFGPADRLLCYLTMTHCFGAVNALLCTLTHGSRLDLDAEFAPEQVLTAVGERGITALYGVPTHYVLLGEAHAADPGRYDLSTLVRGCCGGGAISAELQQVIDEQLGIRGMTHAYGMSESTALITQSDHDDPIDVRLGTAGMPMPGVELRLVDERSGRPVAAGEAGEIEIRGFNVHAGYFGLDVDPSARDDGWWATGDLGSLDADGRLTLRGRSKDMYKTSGFNVYPVEVEAYLERHPTVAEVAVVGVPDPRRQEIGVAFVIGARDAVVDPEEIRRFAREGLVGYKAPAWVFVVDDLPRSAATLKVQKNVLRTQAAERIAAAGGGD